jgi:hypothetical protein
MVASNPCGSSGFGQGNSLDDLRRDFVFLEVAFPLVRVVLFAGINRPPRTIE